RISITSLLCSLCCRQSLYGIGFVAVGVWVFAIAAVLILGCCYILGGGLPRVLGCGLLMYWSEALQRRFVPGGFNSVDWCLVHLFLFPGSLKSAEICRFQCFRGVVVRDFGRVGGQFIHRFIPQ
ncbi:hypothetical protein L195_g048058, partial [Trifolium pratense]